MDGKMGLLAQYMTKFTGDGIIMILGMGRPIPFMAATIE